MTDTDTDCGLNKNIVAKADPNPESPKPKATISRSSEEFQCNLSVPRKNILNVHGLSVASSSTWSAFKAIVSMFATTGSANLSESRVSYLTRLSVEVNFSNDVVVADILESMVSARAGLRPDRVPDMIAVVYPHAFI